MKNKGKLIKVLQSHIENGKKYICRECPIALAINEALNIDLQTSYVSVGSYIIAIYTKSVDGVYCVFKKYKTPRSARRFIFAFDCGQQVKHFNFILREV